MNVRGLGRGVASAGAVAVIAAVMVGSGSFSAGAQSQSEQQSDGTQAAKREFAALRRPQVEADKGAPFRAQAARLGVAPADIRKLQTRSQWKIWAAPSQDGACLQFAGPADDPGSVGGVCAPAKVVTQEGLVGISEPAPGYSDVEAQVVALIPDGVDAVELQLADGSSTAVAVVDNVVAKAVKSAPVALSYTGRDGSPRSLSLRGGN